MLFGKHSFDGAHSPEIAFNSCAHVQRTRMSSYNATGKQLYVEDTEHKPNRIKSAKRTQNRRSNVKMPKQNRLRRCSIVLNPSQNGGHPIDRIDHLHPPPHGPHLKSCASLHSLNSQSTRAEGSKQVCNAASLFFIARSNTDYRVSSLQFRLNDELGD